MKPFLDIKFLFQKAGIAFREILFEIFHFVATDGPNLVFAILVNFESIELQFYHLWCIFQKKLLDIRIIILFSCLGLNPFQLGKLVEKRIGLFLYGIVSCILLLSSLADYLEIDQSVYPLCRNP